MSYFVSEAMHTFLFGFFIFCLIRIFFVKNTPFTQLFVASFFGSHTIYNGCPITSTQNFLLDKIGWEFASNTFLRANLGTWELPTRILALVFCGILYFKVYKFFIKNVPVEDWWKFWLEADYNKPVKL
jgi:hypothetical protein